MSDVEALSGALYSARVVQAPEPGTRGGSIEVGVFRCENGREEQVGAYVRNYHALFSTFYAFRKHETDYALYSPHYTATRVMELPSCRDLGGEEPDSYGFCPVDYYVPSYVLREGLGPD